MLADFYIPKLSNNIKIVVEKNHLGGQILDPSKNDLKIQISFVKIFFDQKNIQNTRRKSSQLNQAGDVIRKFQKRKFSKSKKKTLLSSSNDWELKIQLTGLGVKITHFLTRSKEKYTKNLDFFLMSVF